MGNMLPDFTDGLGNARRNAQALRNGQERFETAPELPGDDEPSIGVLADAVIEVIGRACRTDGAACCDLLREAAAMLETLADEVADEVAA